MGVEVAPLPDGGVGPAAREVGLGLALHAQVVRRELAALRHVAHDVEQPVAHAPREVQHLALAARLHDTTTTLYCMRYIQGTIADFFLGPAPATV